MTSEHEHSVSEWLAALKADESIAGHRIWDRYMEKVARLALRRMGNASRRVADEYDVVAEVFNDFLLGVREGRFERLSGRDDLWQVLAMLTERKAVNVVRRGLAAKRGRGRVQGESALDRRPATGSVGPGMGQFAGREPSPDFAVDLADMLNHVLRGLADETLRSLVRDTLAGYTQDEMAQRHGISVPTVQRKLRLVREKWRREAVQ